MPLGFGKVVATVIEVVGDSSDVGSLPDVIGATSVVVAFNPSWTSFITPESKRIVNVKPIECSVASDGTLLDPQGAPGVWLLAGEYTVTFTHSHHPNITINVTDAHTDEAPLILGAAAQPSG